MKTKKNNGNKENSDNRKTTVKKLVRRSYLSFSKIELMHFNNFQPLFGIITQKYHLNTK